MGSGSRTKKSKQKLVFAKDKKQAMLAFFVLILFGISTIYSSVKYHNEQNPTPVVAQNTVPSGSEENIRLENSLDADAAQPVEQSEKNIQNQTGQNQNDPSAVNNIADNTTNSTNITDVSQNQTIAQDANNIYSQTLGLQKNPPVQNSKAIQSSESDIEIIPKKLSAKGSGKTVLITVTNSGRSDPFLPSGENVLPASYSYLLPPPESLPTANTDAGKIITTTISGILYDKYSPSAIINIEGADYLVKKGDVINNYKILSIGKTQVIVQLGKNIYTAGVGELLSPTSLNYNTIANLNKKFGGNDISINVKRKNY